MTQHQIDKNNKCSQVIRWKSLKHQSMLSTQCTAFKVSIRKFFLSNLSVFQIILEFPNILNYDIVKTKTIQKTDGGLAIGQSAAASLALDLVPEFDLKRDLAQRGTLQSPEGAPSAGDYSAEELVQLDHRKWSKIHFRCYENLQGPALRDLSRDQVYKLKATAMAARELKKNFRKFFVLSEMRGKIWYYNPKKMKI